MKLNQLLGLATVAIALSSCSISKSAFNASKEIAVISITSSNKVKSQSSLQARLLSDVRIEDTTLTDPAGKVQSAVFNNIEKRYAKKFVSEEEITSLDSFEEFAENNTSTDKELQLNKVFTLGVGIKAAEGYPILYARDKKTMLRSFKYLPRSVDAVAIINNNFQFIEDATFSVGGISTAGMGKQRVQSLLTISIYNRDAKKVFYKSFIGNSGGKLGSKNNRYSLDELADQALFESTKKMNDFLKKKIK